MVFFIASLMAGVILGLLFRGYVLVLVYALALPLIIGMSWYKHAGVMHTFEEIGLLFLGTQAGYICATAPWLTAFRTHFSEVRPSSSIKPHAPETDSSGTT